MPALPLEFGPRGVLFGGGEDGGDEFYAGYAIVDSRDEERFFRCGAAGVVGGDLLGDVGIKLGEGFEIAFGVAAGNAARVFGACSSVGAVARQRHRRFAVAAEVEVVGIF